MGFDILSDGKKSFAPCYMSNQFFLISLINVIYVTISQKNVTYMLYTSMCFVTTIFIE